MKKKETTPKAKYQIKAIELIESSLNAIQNPLKVDETFKFDINLQHKLNNDKKLIIVVCTVSIHTEEKDKQFAHIKSSCIYHIQNWDEFIDTKTKELIFPADFLTALNAITISSTRGMLFSFLRGTFLHNAILPVIDLQSFTVSKK